jgi:DNA repair protein RadC
MTTLYVRENDSYREARAEDVIARAQGLIAQRYRAGSPVLSSPSRTREYLTLNLGALDYEVFGCIYLTKRHQLICAEHLFRGTLDGASVHPREVVKAALAHGAAGCIAFHNHPSGIATPSQADEFITTRLKEALGLLDVRLIDHLIVGEKVYSFAEAGRL